MKKQKNIQLATKVDVENAVGGFAVITAKEFANVHKRIDTVSDKLEALNGKVDTGFEESRKEMHEGFRAVLAAI